MISTRFVMTTVLATFTLLVAGACGSSTDPNQVTEDNASEIGNDLARAAEESAAYYNFDPSEGLITTGPCPDGGTVSEHPQNDPSDPDNDFIPVYHGMTFTNCTALGVTINGNQWRQDTKPAEPAFAWQAARDNLVLSTLNSSVIFDVIVTALNDAGYELDVAGSRAAAWLTQNQLHYASDIMDWALNFTPDGTWDPISEALPAGNLTIVGIWNFNVDGVTKDATLTTLTPLHATLSCLTGIESGTVQLAFAQNGTNSTITVTWTGCGSTTETFT